MPPKQDKAKKGLGDSTQSDTEWPDIANKLMSKMNSLSSDVSVGFESIKKDISELKALKETVENVASTANVAMETASTNAKAISSLQSEVAALQASISQLKLEHQSLDCYTRRDNLRFVNIPEQQGEVCEKIIREFMVQKLQMSSEKVAAMKIVRCHRLKFGPENAKPIICRFHFYGDRQEVWNQKAKLKGTTFVIQEDFPPEITRERNLLAPIMFEARRQGKRANLVVNKLIIENNAYTIDSLDQLPDDLNPSKLGTKKINSYTTAFYGALTPLSNFYKAPFKDNQNKKYEHTEQYFQYHKALAFNDEILAAKILATKNPGDCKFLGKRVKGFDINTWETKCKDIMKKGLSYKFTQNRNCLEALKATGETSIVEASRSDRYWGIGMAISDKDIGNSALWGENIMGQMLEDLRDEL